MNFVCRLSTGHFPVRPCVGFRRRRRLAGMKAIRVHAPGGPEALRYEDIPNPSPKAGEALVRVEAAGVNFIEVYFRTGVYKPAGYPFTPGGEAAGVVEAVGAGVTSVRPGDRVATVDAQGAYAEWTLVAAARLVPVPEGVDVPAGRRRDAAGDDRALPGDVDASRSGPATRASSTRPRAAWDSCSCRSRSARGARVIGTVSTEEKAALAREAGADEVDPLHEGGLRRRDEAADRRAGRRGRLRLGREDDLREGPRRPRAARHDGALRPVERSPSPRSTRRSSNAKGSLFLTRPSLFHYVASRDRASRAGRRRPRLGRGRDAAAPDRPGASRWSRRRRRTGLSRGARRPGRPS